MVAIFVARENDDGEFGLLSHGLQCRQPTHARHRQIENDQIDILFADHAQGLLAAADFGIAIPDSANGTADHLAYARIVIHDQDVLAF